VRRWGLGQKVAFLLGLAASLHILVRVALTPDPLSTDGGWFNYAPNSDLAFSPSFGRSPAVIAVVSLVAIAIWTAVAIWLLDRRSD
jgi:hypothetical protein